MEADATSAWPVAWWVGVLIVWAGTLIVAAYFRSQRDLGKKAKAIGMAVAIVAGGLAGWRLWGDYWLGGLAGLVGACSPWGLRLVKGAAGRLMGKVGDDQG